MARWEPDSRDRLEQAAMDLYAERGYQETTVEEIAARAGLTKRTFFRHFADKREVLFDGADELLEGVVAAVGTAPADASPLDAVATGLTAAGGIFRPRDFARRRQAIMEGAPELQERELLKLTTLTARLAGALRERGAPEPEAQLAAGAGMAVFQRAFEKWLADDSDRDFASFVWPALDELRAVAAR